MKQKITIIKTSNKMLKYGKKYNVTKKEAQQAFIDGFLTSAMSNKNKKKYQFEFY